MNKQNTAEAFWVRTIIGNGNRISMHPVLGQYKAEQFVQLFKKWNNDPKQIKLLKTDLYEEAFEADQILSSLKSDNINIFACDVSKDVTAVANEKRKNREFGYNYLTADVRNTPFKDNAFDVILSTSTLDHFSNNKDLGQALLELKRVLHPNGYMIIAINNRHNLLFYFTLNIGRLVGLIPYPTQFYRFSELQAILKKSGLTIEGHDCAVHIIGPQKTFLNLLGKIFGSKTTHFLASSLVVFFDWIGKRTKTRFFTGWFIVLKCVK